MVVLNRQAIRLPRVEKEEFISLLRLGLQYDRDQRTFSIGSCNQIEKLTTKIAEILKVEEVEFTQNCIVCGRDFPCIDCRYMESCATRNLPFECVCAGCLQQRKTVGEHL
ncbi:TPA: hypothetical protein HA273_06745 [Candidatus Bathyarchaeota archaeon]|nr:hypothetical protein [Candidatus Bathyarchaeota archaeon]HIJ09045.1 hypothetical protein [Candidatus Bathyarchaeota archaeon]